MTKFAAAAGASRATIPSRRAAPLVRLAGTGLVLWALAACSTAPAEPIGAPSLPPPKSDAKTQLEYGSPPPRPRY